VALKRTAELTAPQVRAWHAVLSVFPVEVINAAVLEMVMTETRFPEVGDLYQICRRTLPKAYSPMEGGDPKRPSKAEIKSVADRLGLKVSQ
jgi:hypothetical protein